MSSFIAPISRRTVLGATAAALTIPALAACGKSGGSGEEGTVAGSSIVLQTISGLEPNFKKYAEAYTAKFSDRKVEVRASTDDGTEYAQQLATARLSGELPDVFFNVDYMADTLFTNNITLDLVPGAKDGKLGQPLDNFLPQFLGQYRPLLHPDAVTGLPVSADSVALFYNADVFSSAGVDTLPAEDWTWDQLYSVAQQIVDKSGGKHIGLTAPLGNGSNQIVFGPVLKAFGAKYYDSDANTVDIGSDAAVQAWELLIKAYGTASPKYSASPTTPEGEKFDSGNVAITIATSANVPATRTALEGKNWDVCPMPKINGKSTAGGGSYGMSIAQTSKNQAAAWEFLKWFYASDGGMVVAQQVANAIPPTDDGIDHGAWRDVKPPNNIGSFATSARSAVLLTALPGTASATLTTATTKATQEVVLKGRSIKDAFTEAQNTVNAKLAQEKK